MNTDENEGRNQASGAADIDDKFLNIPDLMDVTVTDNIDIQFKQQHNDPDNYGENLGKDVNRINSENAEAQKLSAHSISIWSIGSVVCRICHNAEEPERLISPCTCKGTLAYVHKHCLEHWLRTSGMVSCELCHFKFKIQASLRYTCCQSLRMWYSHPNNRGLLQADFLVCSLLTVVSFGLIGISTLALQYFVMQGKRFGVSRFWTQICIVMFLSLICFVYCVNMFLILKTQLVPWYRWWQSAKDITLILENRKSDFLLKMAKEKNKNSEEIEMESMSLNRDTTTGGTQPQPQQQQQQQQQPQSPQPILVESQGANDVVIAVE